MTIVTPLRRTALARRSELKRRTALTRTQLRRVSAAKRTIGKQRKQADTGPTQATKALLWERAAGRCELCNRDLTSGSEFSRHHRRPRGAGGSSVEWINDVTNLLLLCGSGVTGCHGMVESQRALAYVNGWLIRMTSPYIPAELPVLLGAHLDPVYLTADGRIAEGAA